MNKNINKGTSLLKFFCTYIGLFYIFTILFSCFQYTIFLKVDYLGFFAASILLIAYYMLFDRNLKIYCDKNTLVFIPLGLVYFLFLYLFLYALPFFPLFPSMDFFIHLSNTLNLLKGGTNFMPLSANPGIALLLANWLSLGFENILFASRLFMIIILWSTLPFVFVLGNNIKGSMGGIISSVSYIFFNPFFYFTIVETGLYSNALGLLFCLLTFYWFTEFIDKTSLKGCILMFFSGCILLLSHSSNVLIFPTLLFSAYYLMAVEGKKIFWPNLFAFFLSVLIVAGLNVQLISRLPSTLSGPLAVFVTSLDPISKYLSIIPILEYMYNLHPLTVYLFFLSLVAALISIYKRKFGFNVLPFFWLMLITVVSYFSTNVIRFSLIAFTPLSLLASQVYITVLEPLYLHLKKILPTNKMKAILKFEGIIFIIVILILANLQDPFNFTWPLNVATWSREQQFGFYEALVWFKENSEANAVAISIGGHPMLYLPLIANRTFLGRFPSEEPKFAYDVLKNYSDGYVVVWNRLHPYNGSFYYVDLYKNSSLFSEVWANEEVTVFKVVK